MKNIFATRQRKGSKQFIVRFHHVSLFAAAALMVLAFAGPGNAQSASTATDGDPIGFPLNVLSEMTDSAWQTIASPFRGGKSADSSLITVSPLAAFHDMIHPEGSPFWRHLKGAGYKFKKLHTVVGIIPKIEFEFAIARELSEADRDAVERTLEFDEKHNSGIIPAIQREIIRTLLAVSDVEGMRVEELRVTMLPLPGVQFVMAPVEEQSAGRTRKEIYRHIKILKKDHKRHETLLMKKK